MCRGIRIEGRQTAGATGGGPAVTPRLLVGFLAENPRACRPPAPGLLLLWPATAAGELVRRPGCAACAVAVAVHLVFVHCRRSNPGQCPGFLCPEVIKGVSAFATVVAVARVLHENGVCVFMLGNR